MFQLPVNDNEQTRSPASPVEATPILAHEATPQMVNSQLGQLSVEVEAYGQQILESDRKNEWKEASTLPVRELYEIGEEIDKERTRVESESGFAQAA
ncbi:MAG TPA: hypothetical protein VF996_01980 [Candidatus Saccharimonadales bacterium]